MFCASLESLVAEGYRRTGARAGKSGTCMDVERPEKDLQRSPVDLKQASDGPT